MPVLTDGGSDPVVDGDVGGLVKSATDGTGDASRAADDDGVQLPGRPGDIDPGQPDKVTDPTGRKGE
ncbi:hypothetical protein [Streptomyces sp. IBSBF 2806]|uniref:hypothetical protein n=1 Tax=Streptomyces sp. IBSBF 2806 TaxID=2903529 RepID=UPI002FDC3108